MKKNNFAFTLIEVLIALLIIAIALAATIHATNDSIRATIRTRHAIIAHWVGMNILSEIQVGMLTAPGQGGMNMLQQQWHWDAKENGSRVIVLVSDNHRLINTVAGYR